MFFPKKSKLFETLNMQAAKIEEAVNLFQEMVRDFNNIENMAEKLKRVEDEADRLVHEIKMDVEKTFLLPIDKDDAQNLTEYFDNVIDNLEQTANRIHIYRIPKTDDILKGFAELIKKAVAQIRKGLDLIKNRKQNARDFIDCFQEIHTIENQGDYLHRSALEKLMNNQEENMACQNILLTIKTKEIYQTMEDTLDECEKIANLFEAIRIKYQ